MGRIFLSNTQQITGFHYLLKMFHKLKEDGLNLLHAVLTVTKNVMSIFLS